MKTHHQKTPAKGKLDEVSENPVSALPESQQPGPEDSDGLRRTLSDSSPPAEATGTADASVRAVDPLIDEYGPLFFVKDDNIYGNQLAIAAKFANDHQIRFDPEAGVFKGYSATIGAWAMRHDPDVKGLLAKFIKQQAEANNAKDFLRKRTNAFLSAVLALLKGFTLAVDKDRLYRVIHVANGMLDLSVTPSVLRPHAPSFLSRRLVAIPYRPEAKCPRFLDDLLAPALSADDIGLLQRFLGAVLLGGNAAQRFLILYGGAALGKSTLVTLIEWIMGLDNVAHFRADHLASRFETSAFRNKTLLTAKDVPGDYLAHKGAQMIKALVGGDPFEAEIKYGGKSRLHGSFNLIVTSNNRLRLVVEDDEDAWRRRLLIIRFEGKPVEKRIANFAELLLRKEAEGILAWMVEGAIKHLEELDGSGDFTLSKAQQDHVDDLLHESRSPEIFVAGRVIKKKEADVTVEELTHGYLDFCRAKGWEPFRTRQFENELFDLMEKFHGMRRRNDLTRGTKWHRGFKHVAIKVEEAK